MKTGLEFLEQEVYLPGYMTIRKFDYSKKSGLFEFNLIDFNVSHISEINYLTPRGLHLCISQSTYLLGEELLKEGEYGLDLEDLRKIILEGRVKIVELNQKFRKEVKLKEKLQGKLDLTNLREGKMPLFMFDFDFGNHSIYGNLVTLISPKPLPQTNVDLSRLRD